VKALRVLLAICCVSVIAPSVTADEFDSDFGTAFYNEPKKKVKTYRQRSTYTPPKRKYKAAVNKPSSTQDSRFQVVEGRWSKRSYRKFMRKNNYPYTFDIYENPKLLAKANPANTKVLVDISDQRVKLMVGDQVALDAPASTGSNTKKDRNTGEITDKSTPTGTFPIKEKIVDKQSGIYGRIYDKKGKLLYAGDKRKYYEKHKDNPEKLTDLDYKGTSMPYWMRLTNDGVGLHSSQHVGRAPSSNGCIRLPEKAVKKIFERVAVGTMVKIDI
jgi:lipoprotein-anchoring transpeptidase ErfK/SrfK